MIALREGLRVTINVIEDHRDKVSEVSLFLTCTADVLDQPLESRPIPDTTTAVLPCCWASRHFVDPKNDVFRHRGENVVACLGHLALEVRSWNLTIRAGTLKADFELRLEKGDLKTGKAGAV
ncbi:MAG: hypothetical protein ACT4OI_06330 [Methanobacteriota archaeon]